MTRERAHKVFSRANLIKIYETTKKMRGRDEKCGGIIAENASSSAEFEKN